ncbi:MAG TPA: hypothetical protein VI589_13890, partial [Vicinamibacteria bacterium]
METDNIRQLPDGEELVIVHDTSPFPPDPTDTDPRASSLHRRRQAAVATKHSDQSPRHSWSPSST